MEREERAGGPAGWAVVGVVAGSSPELGSVSPAA